MTLFMSNYPASEPGKITLLSTPERTGALPEFTGRSVVIAFIDSGFYAHADLGDRIIGYADATTARIVEGGRLDRPHPHSWHGQMTTVIACGDGHNSSGRYRGLASEAKLLLIKVMNNRNEVKEADILRGMRWLARHHERFGVRILNLSVGGDFISHDPKHPIYDVVRRLVKAGITVIAAAGNRGQDYVVPPASAPEVITVGGIDDHNSLDRSRWTIYHHNYGVAYNGLIKPDVLAPAVWIASPILPKTSVAREARWLGRLLHIKQRGSMKDVVREVIVKRYQLLNPRANIHAVIQERIHAHKLIDSLHQYVDGTSVAAPIVTSIVAQMLEADPNLTPEQIKTILLQTSRPLHPFHRERQGAGVVSAADAVRAVRGR